MLDKSCQRNASTSGRQSIFGREVVITSGYGNLVSWHSRIWRMSDHRVTLTKVTLLFPGVQSLCMKAEVKR